MGLGEKVGVGQTGLHARSAHGLLRLEAAPSRKRTCPSRLACGDGGPWRGRSRTSIPERPMLPSQLRSPVPSLHPRGLRGRVPGPRLLLGRHLLQPRFLLPPSSGHAPPVTELSPLLGPHCHRLVKARCSWVHGGTCRRDVFKPSVQRQGLFIMGSVSANKAQ